MLLMMGIMFHHHNTNQEYWLKKAFQEILEGGSNSAYRVNNAASFYTHVKHKYEFVQTPHLQTSFQLFKFQIHQITHPPNHCLRPPMCDLLPSQDPQPKTISLLNHTYSLPFNGETDFNEDYLSTVQDFHSNYHEAIPGQNYSNLTRDVSSLLDAYSNSSYIDDNSHLLVIQTFFTDSAQYVGIGQEVYEVQGAGSVRLITIDSVLFQPDLLHRPTTLGSYALYSLALVCVIVGCGFFLIVDVRMKLSVRLSRLFY